MTTAYFANPPRSFPRRHPILAAVAGILALGVVAVLAILYVTEYGQRPEAPAPVPVVEAPSRMPDAHATPLLPPPSTVREPTAVQAARAQEVRKPNLAKLIPSKGRFVISHAIEEQAPQLARCFRRSPGPRSAPDARAVVGRGRGHDRRDVMTPDSPGILRLELEPQPGEIWIVDAAVEQKGTGSDAELACATKVLKGTALDVPGTTPGERVAMLYPLP